MGLVPALKAFESCEHQAIRLTRERGGEQRVMFRVSCQLLSERDQILSTDVGVRRVAPGIVHKGSMIAHAHEFGNLGR